MYFIFLNLRSELDIIKEIQINNVLHPFLQSLIGIIDKSFLFKNINIESLETLYYFIRNLLICDKLPINTIYNCGLLLVKIDYNYLQIASSIWVSNVKKKKFAIFFNCIRICQT